jgi:nucleoid DNA-binding protein
VIKDDLVKALAAKFNLSGNLAGKIVQAILDELVNGLVSGSRIELRRFGVFATKRQAARIITLPSGKKIKRPAQRVVTFSSSPSVKKKLNPPTTRKYRSF